MRRQLSVNTDSPNVYGIKLDTVFSFRDLMQLKLCTDAQFDDSYFLITAYAANCNDAIEHLTNFSTVDDGAVLSQMQRTLWTRWNAAKKARMLIKNS